MNSIFKNALMVTLLVSSCVAVRANVAEDQLFDAFVVAKKAKAPYVSTEDLIFGGAHKAPTAAAQTYWSQMAEVFALAASNAKTMSAQVADYVQAHTPTFIAETATYLAEMPKSVDGASLGGYATADNAKNVLAKVGVAAVVVAAAYGIYKVACKKEKKEVDCAPIRFV